MSQDKGGKGSQGSRRQGMSQNSTSQNIYDKGDTTVCLFFSNPSQIDGFIRYIKNGLL